MENLNNGNSIKIDEIMNLRKAAKDFAEGSLELEQLLLICFSKGIKTTACCRGHKEKNRIPYISFLYSPENMQYIYAIISKLKDKGFNFRYNKLSDGRSFFNVEETETFSFEKPSTLFSDLIDVVNSYDKSINYYEELPDDLKSYNTIIKTAEQDGFLKTDDPSEYFQMCYEKKSDGYEYTMFSSDSYYNSLAKNEYFTRISSEGSFPSYNLKVPEREMANVPLKRIASKVQGKTTSYEDTILPKVNENDSGLDFVYDERTRNNSLINHLRVYPGDTIENVAGMLKKCRDKGIYAYAIFNGIEINNYEFSTAEDIIIDYDQKLNIAREQNSLSSRKM